MNIIAKFDSEKPFIRQVKVIFLRMATEYLILQPLTFVKRVILLISIIRFVDADQDPVLDTLDQFEQPRGTNGRK